MIPTLTPNSYATWSIKIKMILIRAEIFDVVDGLFVLVPLILQTIHYGNPRVQKQEKTSYFIVVKKNYLL
jgi:hypothetical protein